MLQIENKCQEKWVSVCGESGWEERERRRVWGGGRGEKQLYMQNKPQQQEQKYAFWIHMKSASRCLSTLLRFQQSSLNESCRCRLEVWDIPGIKYTYANNVSSAVWREYKDGQVDDGWRGKRRTGPNVRENSRALVSRFRSYPATLVWTRGAVGALQSIRGSGDHECAHGSSK